MTYVPKSAKLILEAKQQLHNDVVQHSFIISYNIQYTHILYQLTSYIMVGRSLLHSHILSAD